jgi:ATP-binding cassette subfamily B protein
VSPLLVVLYSRKFSGPIREAANIISEIQAAVAAAERVFRLIDEAPELPDKEDATQMNRRRATSICRTSRSDTPKARNVLKDLTIDVQSGSLIAIVGPTGAGKTTIVNLLMALL